MAAGDITWNDGSVEIIQSSDASIDVFWGDGTVFVVHEYVASVGGAGNPWYYYAQMR
jgi:hypothetical protein